MFQTFSDVEAYLNSLVNFEHTFPLGGTRNRPKLQPALDAVERLSLSTVLPRCIHIAGTVGKGTVAGYLEAMLSVRHRTLSFTSPHLISVKERVRLNGQELDDEIWCRGFESIVSRLNNEPAIKLTYFEIVFIFYLWVSRDLNCKCHVVETGLGGSFDVTNILQDTTAVLTQIDYDHTAILGKTLTEITTDKCGIIKSDSVVISAAQQEESLKVIAQRAEARNSKLELYGRNFSLVVRAPDELEFTDSERSIRQLHLSQSMDFQRENAAVAIMATLTADSAIQAKTIRSVLNKYVPPARQQLLPGFPPIIVDTAHNPAGFKALAEMLRQKHEGRRIKAVIGMMKDKDARSSLENLLGIVECIMTVSTGNPRSLSPEELCDIAQDVGIRARAYSENEYAYLDLHEDRMITMGIVTGSFYVAGDYLKWRKDAGVA